MYHICRFRTTWSLIDQTGNPDQPLEPQEVHRIKELFAGLPEDTKTLFGLQIVTLPPKKRQQPIGPQEYLICKTFSRWLIYNGKRQTDRWLTDEEIAWIKRLFPRLTADASNTLEWLVSIVPPNKLLQLPNPGTSPTTLEITSSSTGLPKPAEPSKPR